MDYLILIIGLAMLLVGGDTLVKGSVAIAGRFKVSPLVVGMTIVAFGTSAPELIVSLMAAVQGKPEIALGNVIGSNIANIGLILGLTALILPIPINVNCLKKDWPVMMVATLLFWLFASFLGIDRWMGILLFLLLILYTVWSVMKGRKEYVEKEAEEVKHPSLLVATFLIVVSPVILAFGADFLIKGASAIAASFGVSERVIGVTVVAFGTSVPELVASLVAAFRKEMDISVGNIIGSNLFNICSVIGLTAIISPIPVNYPSFVPDFRYMTLFAVLLPLLIIPFRKSLVSLQSGTFKPSEMLVGGRLGRMGGLLLVAVYLYFILRLFF